MPHKGSNRQHYILITEPQHRISLLGGETSDGRGAAGIEETFLALEEELELGIIGGLGGDTAEANARKEQRKTEPVCVEHAS